MSKGVCPFCDRKINTDYCYHCILEFSDSENGKEISVENQERISKLFSTISSDQILQLVHDLQTGSAAQRCAITNKLRESLLPKTYDLPFAQKIPPLRVS